MRQNSSSGSYFDPREIEQTISDDKKVPGTRLAGCAIPGRKYHKREFQHFTAIPGTTVWLVLRNVAKLVPLGRALSYGCTFGA